LAVAAAAIGGLMRPLIHVKERAQGLVEYALILLFVAIVLVFALTLLGGGIVNVYTNIIGAI
jgi:pilus assembly protein Flp/PilA